MIKTETWRRPSVKELSYIFIIIKTKSKEDTYNNRNTNRNKSLVNKIMSISALNFYLFWRIDKINYQNTMDVTFYIFFK